MATVHKDAPFDSLLIIENATNSVLAILVAIGLLFTGCLIALAVFAATLVGRLTEYFEFRRECRHVRRKIASQFDDYRVSAVADIENSAANVASPGVDPLIGKSQLRRTDAC